MVLSNPSAHRYHRTSGSLGRQSRYLDVTMLLLIIVCDQPWTAMVSKTSLPAGFAACFLTAGLDMTAPPHLPQMCNVIWPHFMTAVMFWKVVKCFRDATVISFLGPVIISCQSDFICR